ncbi:MAG: hypothetical protein CRN43_05515, partial [Candidatus Nephrothrix sp. EaCA]
MKQFNRLLNLLLCYGLVAVNSQAQNANLTNNMLDLGYGINGREWNAGKIGYQTFTHDALDIVGAGGPTAGSRKIKFWNEGGAAFTGNVGIGADAPTEKLQVNGNGLFSGQGLFGNYPRGGPGQIAAISLEVGGTSTTGPRPHATIYFHHHRVIANQLRYSHGVFYFERCTNGWGSHAPRVAIGNVTAPGSYSLAVGGKIAAVEEIRVFNTGTSSFPDYVFEASYRLPTLEYTEKYIKQHKHLPEVPSAAEIGKEGMSLNGMSEILLKKGCITNCRRFVLYKQTRIFMT